eukprot:TRINITY_DN447_c0_g1_i2.p1 TRINITY_DN447_c0_g1~~TRINITY_DN447_c0_g1_i2.p1  ORF type:complete len:113 (+),score=18.50 TRINITY_DN447_c0_g1_i2:381-719(+)
MHTIASLDEMIKNTRNSSPFTKIMNGDAAVGLLLEDSDFTITFSFRVPIGDVPVPLVISRISYFSKSEECDHWGRSGRDKYRKKSDAQTNNARKIHLGLTQDSYSNLLNYFP